MDEHGEVNFDWAKQAYNRLSSSQKVAAWLLVGIVGFGASSAVFRDLESRNEVAKNTRKSLINKLNRSAGQDVLELVKPDVEGGPYSLKVDLPNCTNNSSYITEESGQLVVTDRDGNKYPFATDDVGAFKPLQDIDAFDVGTDICGPSLSGDSN